MSDFVLDGPVRMPMDGSIPRDPGKDRIAGLQTELDANFAIMKDFNHMDPSDVLMALSAMSARASEVRGLLQRDQSQRGQSFRTREVDPFIEECDRQFKFHSRLQTVREQEWKMAGGQYA